MSTSHWKRVTDLVLEALEVEESAREGFLDEKCTTEGGEKNTALRDEAAEWLAAAQKAEDLDSFNSPLVGLAEDAATAENLQALQLPGIIGPWRPVRRLGSGGMGVVYEAERVDETFDQRAALKLVRTGFLFDLGARFVRERAVLAGLNHPGIARLLDGGVADDGTPYFATELVEGSSILKYAEEHKLSVAHKLELFLQVCDTVAYAHQHLVVHRDIKPSHIIVAKTDAVPVIKLLDFGIAKLLDSSGEELTGTGSGPFTPSYASPEQIAGQPVSTATDVYSMGVLLYELLANVRPYDLSDTTAAQTENLVCRVVPARPSSAASDPSMSRLLRGELDQIVMKAISKEPARRYGSAQSFGDDIRRYLNGLPIEALPDRASYRIRKFVSRHKGWVVASALTSVVLAVLITVFTISLAQERNHAQRSAILANEQAERAQAVAGFLENILRAPNSRWYVNAKNKGPDTPIREVLDEAAQRVESDFKSQPDLRADLHHILGDTYMSLGATEETYYHHNRTLALRESLYVAPHPKIAEAIFYISYVDGDHGKEVERALRLRQALDMLRLNNEGNNYPFIEAELSQIAARLDEFAISEGLIQDAKTFVERRFVEGSSGYVYRDLLLDHYETITRRIRILSGSQKGVVENESATNDSGTNDSASIDSSMAETQDGAGLGLQTLADWLEQVCYSGFNNLAIGAESAAEQSLLSCYDFRRKSSFQLPSYSDSEAGVIDENQSRPLSIRDRAAAALFDLYTARGDEASASEFAAESENYARQKDSLTVLFKANRIFDDIVVGTAW